MRTTAFNARFFNVSVQVTNKILAGGVTIRLFDQSTNKEKQKKK